MKKDIAISINHFKRGGGMESYTFDLVNQIHADDHPLHIYAGKFDTSLAEYGKIQPHLINQRRIPKKLRPYFFSSQLQKQRQANEYLIACNQSDHADVFVCGGTHLGYLHHMQQKTGLLDRLAIRRNQSNYQTARLIMAHSGLMKQEITDLYSIPADKVQVVYPPVNTERFHHDHSQNNEVRQRYGFQPHETVFLFPSTGHKRKGLDLLARFFERTGLPVKLAVAGSPLPRPMKNVVELGFCSNMPELYRAADYTIMASLYEPFGLVGIESVLSGTRVVFSDNMACSEVLTPQAGFFFSRSQAETLAQAIEQAVELKRQGAHKISEPHTVLRYDPTVRYHVNVMYQLLEGL